MLVPRSFKALSARPPLLSYSFGGDSCSSVAVMDAGSQHLIFVLDALASAQEQLRSFGYQLYLDTRAKSWTQPRCVSFCRKGHMPSEPALTFGFAIWRDSTGDRSIVFSVLVAWNALAWSVQASVEDEDLLRDMITDTLWESPEYVATTLEELVTALQNAVHALTSSVRDQRVATSLAAVERRP